MPAPSKSRPAAAPARKPVHRLFEFDRTVLIRAAFVIVVVLFLYMILRVSMIAYGGSAQKEAKRIERAIDSTRVQEPAPASGAAAKAPRPTPPLPPSSP